MFSLFKLMTEVTALRGGQGGALLKHVIPSHFSLVYVDVAAKIQAWW